MQMLHNNKEKTDSEFNVWFNFFMLNKGFGYAFQHL